METDIRQTTETHVEEPTPSELRDQFGRKVASGAALTDVIRKNPMKSALVGAAGIGALALLGEELLLGALLGGAAALLLAPRRGDETRSALLREARRLVGEGLTRVAHVMGEREPSERRDDASSAQ